MKFTHVNYIYKNNWQRWHLDPPLLLGLLLLSGIGMLILYSASNQDQAVMLRQGVRFLGAFLLMFIMAQIPPSTYRHWTPWIFFASLLLLLAVMIMGKMGKGAQRWLDLGIFRFQPSEFVKLAVPMMVAWFFSATSLPPRWHNIGIASLIVAVPFVLIAKQPDLSTALVVGLAGGGVLLFAGLKPRVFIALFAASAAILPILWHYLHSYQQQRVITFLNPERDPLGAGYHIIQSKIAFGSGGLFGKGWLQGSQSHLDFLPEHATDFIFAVCGEEFGFIGCFLVICVILFITLRGLRIAYEAPDTYSRLLAGSLSLTFFSCAFINIGMVTGMLPVAGIPLPLISYGGTAMLSLLASFGLLMSIQCHRTLLNSKG
jgi:rod shape determining protein RodA